MNGKFHVAFTSLYAATNNATSEMRGERERGERGQRSDGVFSWRAFHVTFDAEILRCDTSSSFSPPPPPVCSSNLFEEKENWGSDEEEDEVLPTLENAKEQRKEMSSDQLSKKKKSPSEEALLSYLTKTFSSKGQVAEESCGERGRGSGNGFPGKTLEV